MVDIYSKQANNECATSLYGPDGYCGFGKCIVESDTISHCECFKGFRHDFSFTRYPNCYLPEHGIESITIIALILASISFLFNLYNLKQTIAFAFHLTLTCLMLSGSTLILYIIYIAQGYILRTPSLLMIWVVVSAAGGALYITIYSLTIPIYAALHRPINRFKNTQITLYLIARVVELVPIIITCYYDNQPSSAINNIKFSYALEVFVCILGVDAIVAFLGVAYNAHRMNAFINDVSLKQGNSNNNNNNSERMQRYLSKVRRLRFRSGFGIVPLAIILVVSSSIQFIAGSIPFVFAMFIAGTMFASFVASILALYAKKHKNTDNDEDENNNNAKERGKSMSGKSTGDKLASSSGSNRNISPINRIESGIVPIHSRNQSTRQMEEAKISPES